MPTIITEIVTPNGTTLRAHQWVTTPNTRHEEYGQILGFPVVLRKVDGQPTVRVKVQRMGPYVCDHTCLAPIGEPDIHISEDLRLPNHSPETGWCDTRNDYAYFDIRNKGEDPQ